MCANVVIGVTVVLCELHVTRVVVVDAVVGLTLGLIAHVVVVVFVVAILHRMFCIWRKTLYTSSSTPTSVITSVTVAFRSSSEQEATQIQALDQSPFSVSLFPQHEVAFPVHHQLLVNLRTR